jgi:WD domain, G-beta repeat
MLDIITRQLEADSQIARIKKLLFCACYGRWSKDAEAMSGKELQQCLQMLCDLHPSLVEFKHALYQVVIRLNHSSDYYRVANSICEAVEPMYIAMEPVLAPDRPMAVPEATADMTDLRPRSIQFKIQAPSLQQARVVCEISLEGRKQAQTTVSLPLQIVRAYATWQAAYRRLNTSPRLALAGKGIDLSPEQISECLASTEVLVAKLQNWCQDCQLIQEQIQRLVPAAAPLTVLVSSDLPSLLKLPWNICLQSLLTAYPQTEIVIQLATTPPARTVQVAVILASGAGVDRAKSQSYLAALPNTHCQMAIESSVEQVLAEISQAGSVVAISSHISGYASRERVLINANDSIPMADLQTALRRAVEHGLKLLVWNGGDGLEMAMLLAATGVPYILVTREPLPDRVVNELLKLTLKLMAEGKSLPLAVRAARERLQEIERVFPAASWLPLLCQTGNPTKELQWADLGALPPVEPRQNPSLGRGMAWDSSSSLSGAESSMLQLPEPELIQPTPPSSIAIPPNIDYDTLSLDRCLTGYHSEVHSLAISADRKLIFSGHGDIGCKDNNVKVWLLDSGELLQDLVGHRDAVRALVALPIPQQLWSAGSDGQLLTWDIRTGRVTPLSTAIEGGVGALLAIGGGRYALSGSGNGTIQLWDAEQGQLLRSWSTDGGINGLAVDRLEQLLVSASDEDLSLWDLARGRRLHQLRGHGGSVKAVAITPAGDQVISAGTDRTIRVWDVATGDLLQVLVGHDRPINCLALTPDGRSIISGSDDKTVKIWRLADGILINSLFGHNTPVLALATDKAGRILVTGGYGEIRIWEID